MLTVTFIRHGESEDNTKNLWSGWKDTPLSPLGVLQASALARSFQESRTHFHHIYVSPLIRAHATGKAIHDVQSLDTPFTVHHDLREQHFGRAEGKAWAYDVQPGETRESMIAKGVYPALLSRSDKFEGGESLDDLAVRAEKAVQECVLPHVGNGDAHVALTSHGLCISEMVNALLKLDPKANLEGIYTGLLNTAWTRITVESRGEENEGLKVSVTDVNRSEHLESLSPSDDNISINTDARAFFGGKSKLDTNTPARI